MSLPSEAIPTRHVFLPDKSSLQGECLVCGMNEGFGGLHIPVEPLAPDNRAWRPGDIVRNPVTGGLFAVRRDRHDPRRLEFLELYPTAAQDHAPADAELLVRDGKACCRCLGCSS